MPLTTQAFTKEELDTIRAATPGVKHAVHFNNAGASLMPVRVAQKVMDYLNHELLYGGYETAEKFASEIEEVYQVIANYLNCSAGEIAITENATVAWGQAFQSIPFQAGDVILTSMAEYASNYIAFLQLKKRLGISIEPIPNDSHGQLDVEALEGMIHPKVKLIAVTHVPTNGGLVNPAARIGAVARKYDIWYLLDACQSVGQMPINVKELGCDFLSATSRKFLRGPRGVGFLYVNKRRLSQLEPPVLDLHSASWKSSESYEMREDARRFENWEFNLAGVVGMSEAVKYALELGLDSIWERIQVLGNHLRSSLSDVPGIEVHDLGQEKSGIVSFNGPFQAMELKRHLFKAGFNVSIIRADGTLLDMSDRQLNFMIRASVHYYNNEEEINRFTNFLRKALVD